MHRIDRRGLALALQSSLLMKPRAPQTYDEITRRSVPEPDGSARPELPVAAPAARDGALREVVSDALIACGMTEVGVEITGGRIVLRGWVRDLERADRIRRLVRGVAGDADIVDHLHLGV
ncbi:hypothetical protein BH11MYX3_BH11MYX3_34070 [soil metagenome]